ncbi:Tetratricopeptide repeat protein [Planctomycetes bacterium Pan216]|uniref:Tetratricopeptide repeat protein n=1 Tax=Kolteria novifilia TaxID=2527975 RepID=A0A518B0S7_9BACT|nr:Tetratricopeptide repeat protein [Planctomycetes bacterium Pan216]
MDRADEQALLQAEGYLELELPEPALEALERVGTRARTSAQWHFLTGKALQLRGEFARALPHLESASVQEPDNVEVYLSLGWCYKRTDQLPRAISSLLEAHRRCQQRSKSPEGALVMYNLSCYYALANHRAQTLQWLARALKQEPGYRRMIAEETDFDKIRDDPEFQALARPRDDDENEDDEPTFFV